MKRHTTHRKHQRGAALLVGLMMLVIVTLLAVTAMGTATTELVMAGNEQFRERAFQAAEAGIEQAIHKSRSNDNDIPGECYQYIDADDTEMSDALDAHSTRLSYAGTHVVGKATSISFAIRSTGSSARNATSEHNVSTWVLAPQFDQVLSKPCLKDQGNEQAVDWD